MPPEEFQDGVAVTHVSEIVCPKCGAQLDVSEFEPFSLVDCPSCGAPQTIPAKLGSFMLLGILGGGAMGVVLKGHDATLNRDVAIKVMRKTPAEDPRFAQEFLQEARALAALNHPNIVQIYTCGEANGQLHIVMELVDGGRLDQLIRPDRPMDEGAVMKLALDVAKGLQAASEIGLAHGDLKPQNILFDHHKTAKVVDFGLARFRGDKLRTGEVWGTPYYVAPEVARGAVPNLQSDIYSFGATIFHALAGRPPFEGKTATDTVVARLKGPPPDLRALRKDVRPETAAVITRMLSADTLHRYPNYTSLIADMEKALAATKRGPVTSQRKGKGTGVAVAVAVALLLLAGGGFWAYRRAHPPAPPTPAAKASRYRLVGGKLVPVNEPAGAAATPKPPTRATEASINTLAGRGGDAYVQGSGAGTSYSGVSFGHEQLLWVKAGKGAALHIARKVFLRFDLGTAAGLRPQHVALNLTMAKAARNGRGGDYRLSLWGVRQAPDGWGEAEMGTRSDPFGVITWNNAPDNDRSSPTGMAPSAELLATITAPAQGEEGRVIAFTAADAAEPGKLLDFIAGAQDGLVTFAITANDASDQSTGWRFASREHGRLDPPTLVLKGLQPVAPPAP